MDDCYNANPVSTKAGLDVLAEAEERKVAISVICLNSEVMRENFI